MTQHPAAQPPHPPGAPGGAAILPDDLFARLLGGTVRHGTFADESRGAPRVVLNRRAVFRRYGASMPEQGQPEACTVRDLSVSGVGLLVEGRIEAGQAFVLVMKDPRGDPAALPCVAVRLRPAGADSRRFVVGARFTKDLPRPAAAPAATASVATASVVTTPVATAPVVAPNRRPIAPTVAPSRIQPALPPAAAGGAASAAEVERIRAAMFDG